MSSRVSSTKSLACRAAVSCVLVLLALIASGAAGTSGATARSVFSGAAGPAPPIGSRARADFSDEVVVGLVGELSAPLLGEIESACGGGKLSRAFGPGGKETTIVVRVGPGRDAAGAVEGIRGLPGVLYAEPNYPVQALYTPTDPGFPNQWGLENTGQVIQGTPGAPGADIGATDAWDIEVGTTNPVTVAVLDTGLNFSHADLDSRIWANDDEIPGNDIDDDANGYTDDTSGYNFVGISQTRFYYLGGGFEPLFREFGSAAANGLYAQSITGTGCELTHVGIMLDKVGNPPSGVTVSIRTSLGGPDLAAFDVAPAEVSTSFGVLYKELSTPLSLGSGSTCYLVFATAVSDAANHYHIYENQGSKNGNLYTEGQEWIWDGDSWAASAQDDFYFRTNPNRYPRDDNGHGTFVTGIIGAEHNSAGIAGVSAGCRVMPLKVLDASGVFSGALYVAEIAEATYYAADNGARVISMSLGSYFSSQAWQDAIDYAHGKGVVLAAAAGNDSNASVLYPAGCENVLGVGATTNTDQKASFSNYNWTVDLSAPGKDVYSTSGGGYSYGSGTSAATPHVAGVAALVLAAKPSYGAFDVELAMIDGADDLGEPGRDDYFGYGRLDACGALLAATSTPHIDSVNPAYGDVGDEVVVSGDYFRSSQAGSTIGFNGVPAAGYSNWSEGSVTCVVPAGVSSGPVNLSTLNGTSNGVHFEVGFEPPPDPTPGPDPTPTPGPAPVMSPTWYLAEGSTAWGYSTYISVENPNTGAVDVRATYMTPGGLVDGGTTHLEPESQGTINPVETLGQSDFATKIECIQGLGIAVDRTMSWTGAGAASPEAHSSVGVTEPATLWYLPEGSSNWGFETFLLIQNPGTAPANCTVTYMIEGEGPQEFTKVVPAASRATYNMAVDIGSKDASIKVSSDQPVIPERAMYRHDRREGHDSIGATTPAQTYYLAEGTTGWGFTTFVLIQNPSASPVDVTITYMTPTGAKEQPVFQMPASSRKTINVNVVLPNTDLSTRVYGSAPIIAERAMYWDAGAGEACHDSIGMSAAHQTFYLPDGQVSDGRETFTLVQNPNDTEVSVEVTYMGPTGAENQSFSDTIPANSRKTYSMGQTGGTGREAILVRSLTPTKKIMAERAMYWNSRGAGTDTIGGYSD